MQRILSRESLEFFTRIFGGLSALEKSQVLYSVNLHGSRAGGSLKVILKNEHTPQFPIDWRMFQFLRAIASTSIITGESLRKESSTQNFTTDFFGKTDLQALSNPSHNEDVLKTFFILSRHLSCTDLMTIPLFKQTDRSKLVTITPSLNSFLRTHDLSSNNKSNNPASRSAFADFLQRNSIELTPEMPDLTAAINFLKARCTPMTHAKAASTHASPHQMETPPSKILVETGIASSAELLTSPTSPLDFLVLSVYRGHLDPAFIGESHPDLEYLEQRFHLHHKSIAFPAHQGTIEFYSFIRSTQLNSYHINNPAAAAESHQNI